MRAVITCILLLTSTSALSYENVTLGSARFIYTHSKVANILGKKIAETKALKNALKEITMDCGGENFKIISKKYSFSSAVPPMFVVTKINYECF